MDINLNMTKKNGSINMYHQPWSVTPRI